MGTVFAIEREEMLAVLSLGKDRTGRRILHLCGHQGNFNDGMRKDIFLKQPKIQSRKDTETTLPANIYAEVVKEDSKS